jgi:hypothetical protein
LIVEQNQNTSCFSRHSLYCSRHELALLGFFHKNVNLVSSICRSACFTQTSLVGAFAGGVLVSLKLRSGGLSPMYFLYASI